VVTGRKIIVAEASQQGEVSITHVKLWLSSIIQPPDARRLITGGTLKECPAAQRNFVGGGVVAQPDFEAKAYWHKATSQVTKTDVN